MAPTAAPSATVPPTVAPTPAITPPPTAPTPDPDDNKVAVATPEIRVTPAPPEEPNEDTLRKLENGFTKLSYDDLALRNFSFELTREVARYPRSTRLKKLETDLAEREKEALRFGSLKTQIARLIASDSLSEARDLMEEQGPTFSLRGPVSSLEGELVSAEIDYGDRTQQSIEGMMENSRLTEARRVLARAVIEAPSDPRWSALAERLAAAEKSQAAAAQQREVIEQRGEDIIAAIRAGQAERARELFEDLQSDMPNADLNALRNDIRSETQAVIVRLERLGLQARRENRPEAALELYEKALAFEPDNSMLRDQKDELERVIRQKADKLYETAVASQKAGDLIMAKVTLEQLLELDPTHDKGKGMLVDVLAKLSEEQFSGPRVTDSDEEIRRRRRNAPSGMVYIPGGFYTIGRNDGDPEEGPAHVKKVDGFYIGMREISLREYDQYLRTHTRGKSRPFIIRNTSLDRPDMPVVGVSYLDAQAYAEAQGMRLPTNDEWERLARGGDDRMYPWGNFWAPALLNWAEADALGYPVAGRLDGAELTAPVTDYADGATPEGVFNAYGNVEEWTVPGDDIDEGMATMRGGSYALDLASTRMTRIREARADDRRTTIGFRCVGDP